MNKEAAWVRVQIRAFTQWINQTLEQGGTGLHVEDLEKDFQDGIVFIRFFELLAGQPFPKYIRQPKLKVHKLENINKAFTYMEQVMEVKNPGIQAEDVLDLNEKTNLKLVLGLIWTLFRKYRISVISTDNKSSEEGLLEWVKKETADYKNVKIDRWKNSFNDGMAFLALVHRYDPSAAGFDYESFSPSDPKANLQKAFEVAEKTMGVPQLLEVSDFLDGAVDERSLVLYTSLLFHAFNNQPDREAIEAERRRRAAELEVEKERKARLTEENAKLRTRVEELEEELKKVTAERDDLKEKDKYLSEKVDVMKELVEQETEERDELLARRDKLLAEIADLERRLKIELETKKQGDAQLKEKLTNEEKRVKDLQALRDQLEEEAGRYKTNVEELEGQLDEQRRRRRAAEEQLVKDAEYSSNQLNYLSVFKKNMEEHIRDLSQWAAYLEYDKKSTLDFEVDVRAALSEQMEGGDFEKQLNVLSERLDSENDAINKILKQKQIENEAEGLEKKGKKKK